MSQPGFDPQAQSHTSYEASALPPSHHGWNNFSSETHPEMEQQKFEWWNRGSGTMGYSTVQDLQKAEKMAQHGTKII